MDESILVRIGLDSSAMERGLKGTVAQVSGLNKTFSTVAAGAGIGFLIGKFRELTGWADEINTRAAALGTSAEFLQQWEAMGRNSSVSLEKMNKGLEKLIVNMGAAKNGTDEDAKKFTDYGLALTDVSGRAKTTEEMIGAIADKIKDITDPTLKAKAAYDLFGKSGVELVAILNEGAEGMKRFHDKHIIDQSELDRLNEINVEFAQLENSMRVGSAMGVKLVGSIFEVAGGMSSVSANLQLARPIGDLEKLNIKLSDAAQAGRRLGITLAQSGGLNPEQYDKALKAIEALNKLRIDIAVKSGDDHDKLVAMLEDEANIRRDIAKIEAGKNQTIKQAIEQEAERKQLAEYQKKNAEDLADIEHRRSDADYEQRKNALLEKQEAIRKRLAAISTLDPELMKESSIKRQIDLEKRHNDIIEARRKMENELIELRKKQADAQSDVTIKERELAKAKMERNRYTLQDLANVKLNVAPQFQADVNRYEGQIGAESQRIRTAVDRGPTDPRMIRAVEAARRVQSLEGDIDYAKSRGRVDIASQLQKTVDALRKQNPLLKEGERDPFKSMNDTLKESRDALDAIDTALNEKGALMRPVMGD